MKKNLLSVAVTAAIMVPSMPAFAQDDTKAVEEVFVTGSRIASAVADTPRPVTTVSVEDMQLSGADNAADFLRNSAYNTLGSYQGQSGTAYGSAHLISLKGLGADRTAVMINGRRVPGNPWTGTSAVDISTIPMAAIDRIEILTDSASAVYGADAIGGVVNIIMKKNWEGAEISAGSSSPTRDNADGSNFSFTAGAASDRGSIVFSAEYLKKSTIFDRDRDYSSPLIKGNSSSGGLPVDGSSDLQGINGGGNSAFATDFSEALGVIGPCDSAGLTPVADPFGVPGEGCGYAYANFSAQSRGYERRSTFLSGEYQINDDHTLFFENRFTNKEDAGRFAPAIGGFFFSEDSPYNDLGQDALLYHRFVAHGTRDDRGISNEFDTTFGFKGSLLNDSINYEVYARDYRFNAADYGDNYVLTSVIEELVAAGEYNPVDPFDPANEEAIAASKASLSRDISTHYEGYGVTLNGTLDQFSLSGGAIGWAAGWETAREAYADKYDSYREAGNVLGSAGNSASASRSRDAFFAEAQLPVLENLTTNIAARYDSYSDVGSEFSPMLSVRYQPHDMVTLRASVGEGFKAPNLTDMYSPYSQGFLQTPDYARCEALELDKCPASQMEVFTGGNENLAPEEASSWNIGVVLAPIDSLTLSADWWNVKLDGAVKALDLDDLLLIESTGSLPNGVYVNRAPSVDGVPGPITRCEGTGLSAPDCGIVNVYANIAETDVEGIDFKANWILDTAIGGFEANLIWSHLRKYNEVLPVLGLKEQAGTQEFPENKVNFALRYNRDNLTLAYNYTWLAETESDYDGVFPSWQGHDVSAVYTAPFGTEFSLGIRNLTDEDPTIESATGWNANTSGVSMALSPIEGRVYTGTIRHRF
ncbi:vitamin B12 transporter BtuB [Microbulbifer aestuariivivens]|uniref:Vitamin B12 transporter BtuB n=1 Tax=Microbulbifer aestuariivivens TaxID=1908308 RepID=A0ABP9WLT7_9GAMM